LELSVFFIDFLWEKTTVLLKILLIEVIFSNWHNEGVIYEMA